MQAVQAQTQSLTKYLTVAKQTGCTKDQMANFRRGGVVILPKQLEFSAAARLCDQPGGPTQVGFGGSRGPGKSFGAFAQLALDDCQRFPGLKCLYLRKIGKNAREQFEDLRQAVLHSTPHKYNRGEGVVYFPYNNSKIITGHFNRESDVDNYLGKAYDAVVIEEATTLTRSKMQAIRDSNRSTIPGYRPRIYYTTNPGGIGHMWFKSAFIEPARNGTETDTRFIFATADDNPYLDDDYRNKLEANVGWRLQAYRYGNWDIMAGQFFTLFNSAHHSIPPKFDKIPKGWPVWGAFDYGYVHPTVYQLHTTNEGVIYTVDELWRQRGNVERNATSIKQMWAKWGVWPRLNYAGHDIWSPDDSGAMIVDKYKAAGVRFERANIDRINGWAEMLDRMGDPERGIVPRWQIFDNCKKLIEGIPTLQHNPRRAEDVLKVDVDELGQGGDDSGDTARYALASYKTRRGGGLAHGKVAGW